MKKVLRNGYIRDGRSPLPGKEITSKIMSSIKAKNTLPELLFRKALFANGIRGYRCHYKKAVGKPDICFVNRKIAIFINGCFWHGCPKCKKKMPTTNSLFWETKINKNIERDQRKAQELTNAKWRVLIFWECEVKNNIKDCFREVKKTIEGNKCR